MRYASDNNRDVSGVCAEVRSHLSGYTDSALAAREAWMVEKHLAACDECAREARALRMTVDLVRAVPKRDTSPDFMASLHARLDTVDPDLAPVRPAWERLRAWLLETGRPPVVRRAPALSLGLAIAGGALFMLVNRNEPPTPVTTAAPTAETVNVSIASSASSPFSDPAADNLELRSTARSGPAPAAL